MSDRKMILLLRRRVSDLEEEIALLKDQRPRLMVDAYYNDIVSGAQSRQLLEARAMRDMNASQSPYPPPRNDPQQERDLPARDPQPKVGWLRSIWRATLGLFE